MQYFVQETFVTKVKILSKNNSYKDCENAIIESVFKVTPESLLALCSAQRLNTSSQNAIAKLRISFNAGKSSSYRIYVFALIKDEHVYFAYIYPKTGSKSQAALDTKEEKTIIRELLENYKANKFSEVFLNTASNKICYSSSKEYVFK